MQPRHFLMTLLIVFIWGINFVFIKMAVGGFPPLLLTGLRFVISSLPVFFFPRPKVRWRDLILVSFALFFAQFAFLFCGIAYGMPPGLASAVLQVQAFLTIFFAYLLLGEKPGSKQITGSAIALLGLCVVALAIGGDASWLGFGLTLASAIAFGLGNVLLRKSGGAGTNMLSFIGWMSVFPPLPLFALSYWLEGPKAIAAALRLDNPSALIGLLFISLISTLVGYTLWGIVLNRYRAAKIAPFALLIPVFGAGSSALIFGESFTGPRLWGMAMILAGVGIAILPTDWIGLIKRKAEALARG